MRKWPFHDGSDITLAVFFGVQLDYSKPFVLSLDQGKGVLASIVEVYYSDAERRKGNFRRARDIIIHPGFNPLTRLHNVALLRGDGGGPVEILKGNKAYQVGIISFPKSCDASRDIPSAHERVDYYFEWIKTVIAYYHKWTWHPPDPAPAEAA
ncbi:hypothetical protein HPB51_011524 [Rhipicephalus microplus]|uniref:Peptidase S1 domain-containing protein n=1 Tax=Rhipicephalus microplus TaxID=6941 RepID=A0A9J6E8X4_RHIMP|nr:hypothetical protein HPB51_011524 [Rhipicephalus microplus]